MEPILRRVVVTGSESTGKTTLAERLARHYDAPLSREFSRAYAERVGRALVSADVEPIARGQLAAEDEAIAAARGLAIHDTDLLSTLVYAEHYYGLRSVELEAVLLSRRADLYLLADVDLPWRADPVRDRPKEREVLHRLFRVALDRVECRYLLVGGLGEDRFRAARAAIDELLVGRG